MTTLIPAVAGGVAFDDERRLRLDVPPSALPVDTTVTVVAEPIPRIAGALGAWSIVAHPAPVVLTHPARLGATAPPGTPAAALRFVFAEDPAADPAAWRRLPARPSGDWLVAHVWHLPPTDGPAPTRSTVTVCLISSATP